MKQAYRDVGSACTRVGQATQTAGIFLAGLCLFFGITFAASIPTSLENRIAYLFFVGLIPALVSYVSGHILCRMLGLGCKLYELVGHAAFGHSRPSRIVWRVDGRLCLRRVRSMLDSDRPLFINDWPMWPERRWSVYRWYWRVRKAIFQFSCLLIRNAARFLIRMQPGFGR